MLTVYTENKFEYGPDWSWILKAEYFKDEEYGFAFKRITSIELLRPRQIRALYGFITDEDMEYFVLTTDTNHRIYVQYDPKYIFTASSTLANKEIESMIGKSLYNLNPCR